MKPLLKPSKSRDHFFDQIYASLEYGLPNLDDAMVRAERVMALFKYGLQSRVGQIEMETFRPQIGATNKFNWWLIRGGKRECVGSLDLMMKSVAIELSYHLVGHDWDFIVEMFDQTYRIFEPRTMYVHDRDDWHVQNSDNLSDLEGNGIGRRQVEIVEDENGLEWVDTRANPGYMTWWRGYICSVQWLNYWSADAAAAIFREFPPKSSLDGVEIKALPNGASGLRLGTCPGRYDDVKFHDLQLKVREWLGWKPTMWKLHPVESDFEKR